MSLWNADRQYKKMCIYLSLCLSVMLNSLSFPFTIITMYCTSYHTRSSGSWTRGSWIYNYIWNQHISPLTLRVRILLRRSVLDTALCDKVCQWFESYSGEVYSIQHNVIKFASDLWQVSSFPRVLRFPSPIKLIATIWLKYCRRWR